MSQSIVLLKPSRAQERSYLIFTKLISNLFRSGNISDENKGLIAELERNSETDFETELGHYLSQIEKIDIDEQVLQIVRNVINMASRNGLKNSSQGE